MLNYCVLGGQLVVWWEVCNAVLSTSSWTLRKLELEKKKEERKLVGDIKE